MQDDLTGNNPLMNKKIFFICLSYSIYVISLLFPYNWLSAFLFMETSIMIIGIFINAIKKIKAYRTSWKLLLCAAMSNFVFNLVWILDILLLNDYGKHSNLFITLYSLPNIFIVLATVYYFKKNIDKLESVQLVIDVVTVVILMVSFAIIFLMETRLEIIVDFRCFVVFTYVITDIVSLTIMFIIKLSIDDFEFGKTTTMVSVGIISYALVDLFFIYNELAASSLETDLFIKAFNFVPYVIFTFATLYEELCESRKIRKKKNKLPYNITVSKANGWFILLPLFLLLFLKKLELYAFLAFLVIIFIREFLSYYVKSSFYTKFLLQEEKVMKYKLENMVIDRTLELSEANKRLEDIAVKDYLTKVYNRRFFNMELDRLLKNHEEGSVTVFYIDLVRFKFINDSFGHDSGDNILIAIARRLKRATIDDGIVCRLGGDEFAIIIEGKRTEVELRRYAENLIDKIGKEIILDNYRFEVNVSMGIAVSRKCSTRRNLLKAADFAMYRCKEILGSSYEIYSDELNNQLERRNNIEKLLRNISFDSEFEVYYQPQFDIKTKMVKGLEALVRWKNNELGDVSPAEFIPVAEECGLIKDIGSWVLIRALKEVREWNIKYGTRIRISVNVSAGQINNFDFIKNLMEVVNKNGIETSLVNLELTEGVKIEGNKLVKDNLEKLSELGFSISIDDFGTGYASFSYIEEFNVNELKIDKSLVDNISNKNSDLKVVKAIIMMAKGLNIETIAEGIETEDQLQKIKELGCDEVQGYVWSKPLSKLEFEEKYLKANYCIKR